MKRIKSRKGGRMIRFNVQSNETSDDGHDEGGLMISHRYLQSQSVFKGNTP